MREIHRRGSIKIRFCLFCIYSLDTLLLYLLCFILFARCAIKNIQLYSLLKTLAGEKRVIEEKKNVGTLYFPNVEAKIHTCPAACVTGNGYFSVEISS